MQQFPAIRDLLLFLGGLGGVAHETILTHAERPTLLILFAAMMGLPAFLRSDEKRPPPPPPPFYPPQEPPAVIQTPGPAQLPPSRGQPNGSGT